MKQNFLKICAGTLCAVALSGCLAACGTDSAETAADWTESKSETLSDNNTATAAAIIGTTGSNRITAGSTVKNGTVKSGDTTMSTAKSEQTTDENQYTVVRPKNSTVVIITSTRRHTVNRGELTISDCSAFLERYYDTYGTAGDDYQVVFEKEESGIYHYILKNIVISYNKDGSVNSEKSGLLQVGTVTVNKKTGEAQEYITATKKTSKFKIS